MGYKYLVLIIVSLLIVAVDQVTKTYVHVYFDWGQSITILEGFFNLTYVRNPGAAFGMLSTANESFRTVFFLIIPPVAVLFILFLLHGTPENDKAQIYALALVCGGAIGNYIDRLRFGFVVDFLDFHYKEIYAWPAFNVADSAIVVGITIITLIMIRDFRNERKKKQEEGLKLAK